MKTTTEKHTPGPWEVSEKKECIIIAKQFSWGKRPIAWVEKFIREGDRDKANAQLIAVAPEMLDALKRAYWLLSAQVVGGQNPHLVPCINELESIIAKAEGRSPEPSRSAEKI